MASEGDVVEQQTEVVEVAAPAVKGTMTQEEALEQVLKKALVDDGLVRGAREAIKALDRNEAKLCVLNRACEENGIIALAEALCAANGVPLVKVSDGKQLGEWAGLCKIDRDGNARKVVSASVVVVKSWGEESEGRNIILSSFNQS
ncbi:40S ribosomal protein S12 [Spiromyces aspiralis]|uniref:40S ribosomal protein S12 n=1 Tax=Spiromyces aspiralis TaxID=68401 RepID=A0ACC1HJS8_9FUNG|nr:40S ribosomal protein S12 [Spiromyces aspiralis]